MIRSHFGSRQRYLLFPAALGVRHTFDLGQSWVEPFGSTWGVVAATLPLPLYSPLHCPPLSMMDDPCWASGDSAQWKHSASWKRRRRARLCAARWAFRHALALKQETGWAWRAPVFAGAAGTVDPDVGETADLGVSVVSEVDLLQCPTVAAAVRYSSSVIKQQQPQQHQPSTLMLKHQLHSQPTTPRTTTAPASAPAGPVPASLPDSTPTTPLPATSARHSPRSSPLTTPPTTPVPDNARPEPASPLVSTPSTPTPATPPRHKLTGTSTPVHQTTMVTPLKTIMKLPQPVPSAAPVKRRKKLTELCTPEKYLPGGLTKCQWRTARPSTASEESWADMQDHLSDSPLAQLPVDLTASPREDVPTPVRCQGSSPTPVRASNQWLALVEEVRTTQRRSFAHRERWHAYCDEHLGGTRDPSWHSYEALRAFLDLLATRPALSKIGRRVPWRPGGSGQGNPGLVVSRKSSLEVLLRHQPHRVAAAAGPGLARTSLLDDLSEKCLGSVWAVAKQPKATEPNREDSPLDWTVVSRNTHKRKEYKGKHYSA